MRIIPAGHGAAAIRTPANAVLLACRVRSAIFQSPASARLCQRISSDVLIAARGPFTEMPGRWSDEETTDPLYADDRNFYKVELWTEDEQHILDLLYAGSNLDKARGTFWQFIKRRPRAYLTIRQRTRVLDKWPK